MSRHDGTVIVQWPQGVAEAPAGWHWGAHVGWPGGSGYYLISDDGRATVIAQQRTDMEDEAALDAAGLTEALQRDAEERADIEAAR